PSAALVKATLVNGADDIYPGQYPAGATQEILSTRPTNVAGWGRVDLENSIYPDGGRTLSYKDQKNGLETGEVETHVYTVTNTSQPLKITLAWSDYPALPAAGQALVNDLDLTVIQPTGPTLRYPANGADRLNNLEGIDIPTPQPGAYTIIVAGYNVPLGPQPYALVVSGILGNSPPIISELPDQEVTINKTADNVIDLWAYTWDPQSPDQDLTFSIANSADPDVQNAGVSIEGNRYIDIAPVQDWTGEATVEIKATDSGSLYGTNTFKVIVTDVRLVFLPLVMNIYPPPPKTGFWSGLGGAITFDVTDKGFYLDNFTMVIDVPDCGLYDIDVTNTKKISISNYQFSFGGSFYASGTFGSLTTASGTIGLNSHEVALGCFASGGPYNWTASWQND
ncbi:MAG: PPC domain-containing protein, partial [Anaerolineales bacterium]|nr:PPC domain-containing protein [Anaerolineales bacterium]